MLTRSHARNAPQMLMRGEHPTLACKALRISDFGGKSLGSVGSSSFDVNPDVPEAGHLRTWCVAAAAPCVYAAC